MEIRKIQNADLDGKKVLVRVDFNVAIEKGQVKEKFKIAAAKETIDYLLKKNCKIALISHLGRPEGKKNPEFSLGQLVATAEKILGIKIKFVDDCIGDKVKEALENISSRQRRASSPVNISQFAVESKSGTYSGANTISSGEILLLENVRFYPGDEENNPEFSKELAENFDVFINDAFSASHRDHASVTGVAKILPSFAGWRLQKEIEEMEKIKKDFARPAVAIIGGAKIETKLPVIKFFEKAYDWVLVGGKVANEALDQKINFSEKVILPVDFVDDRLDIGPETVKKFQAIVHKAKTIVWNGPLGKFEEEKYSHGTLNVFKTLLLSRAYKVVGGGETLEILEKNHNADKFDFVSTGGGAMLEYLSGGKMPGIEVLKM